ncbi:MAG: AIR synthase-related protein, partial [Chloroflexota bacterium]
EGMAPFEVMISESQERMLAVVDAARLDDVLEVCRRWGLPAAVVGTITDDGDVVVVDEGVEIARVPARALASESIEIPRLSAPPPRRRAAPAPGETPLAHDGLPERGMDPAAVLEALLGHPNIGSRAWVTTQYDQTVGTDTVAACEHAAGVLRVKGTKRAIVVATDSQPNVALHDPALGASLAVAECARNIAVTGARPLGITNCLNFGDPGVPEAYWQLAESVRGLKDAALALDIPITGGNVSLYNESPLGRIAPTAQIGIVGAIDDIADLVSPCFKKEGDLVVLMGEAGPGLVGSVYERLAGAAPEDRPPSLELGREAALQDVLRRAAAAHLLESAQDVSGGGLAVAIAESAIWGNLGADLLVQVALPPAVVLFGESPSRAVVTVDAANWSELARLASGMRVACRQLGEVGGERLRIRLAGVGATGAAEERGAGVADELDLHVADMRRAWERALPRVMGEG